MNLLLLEPGERGTDGTARVSGERLRHLREVQQYVPGDRLRVGEIGGRLGAGEVLAITEHEAVVRIDALDNAPPAPLPCTLVIALPRPKMLKRILVDATSLGVKRLCFINSWRVDKSYWSSPSLAPEAIADKCRLGLAQAMDTQLPVVTLHNRFRPFVEDELPALTRDRTALVAHPAASDACPRDLPGPVTLVVGPEGGFTSFEVGLLRDRAGCRPVSLGLRVLRVDTVIPALLGRLA